MLGRFQVLLSFWEGGPPIIPPSMYLTEGLEVVMRLSMWRAVLGEMALRSRKCSGLERCLKVELLDALTIRWAVDMASLGGTMEMM
jgi:hypothetical protein